MDPIIIAALIGAAAAIITTFITVLLTKSYRGKQKKPLIIPKEENKKLLDDINFFNISFQLGYNFFTLLGLLIGKRGKIQEKAFFANRHIILQKAEQMNIKIIIPKDIYNKSLDEIDEFLKNLDFDISLKIQSIKANYGINYLYGKWIGKVLTHVANSVDIESSKVSELLNIVIKQFEEDLYEFKDFNITKDVKKKFKNIYNQLVGLSRIGNVTQTDYRRITKTCLELVEQFE